MAAQYFLNCKAGWEEYTVENVVTIERGRISGLSTVTLYAFGDNVEVRFGADAKLGPGMRAETGIVQVKLLSLYLQFCFFSSPPLLFHFHVTNTEYLCRYHALPTVHARSCTSHIVCGRTEQHSYRRGADCETESQPVHILVRQLREESPAGNWDCS